MIFTRIIVIWLLNSAVGGYAQNVYLASINQILNRVSQQPDTLWVLNFWATWCRPCVVELWDFNSFHLHHLDKPIRVLLVSVDAPETATSRVQAFVRKKKITTEVVVLTETKPRDWIHKISVNWSGSIPSTLFVAPKTQKRIFKEQSFDEIELGELVFPLLLSEK